MRRFRPRVDSGPVKAEDADPAWTGCRSSKHALEASLSQIPEVDRGGAFFTKPESTPGM